MQEQRTIYIDNLCGIFILHMIFVVHLGNLIIPESSFVHIFSKLFSCFMPWFFYKSGMFRKNRSFHNEIANVVRKLLLPWISFTLIALAIQFLVVGTDMSLHSTISYIYYNCATEYNLALYFLLALSFSKLVFSIVCSKTYLIYVTAMISLLLAYLMYKIDLHIPYYWGTFALGLFYYCAGWCLRNHERKGWLIWCSIVIYVIHLIFPESSDFRVNTFQPSYFICVLYSLSGIILFDNLFLVLCNKRIFAVSNVGKNSIVFYVTHFPLMILVNKVLCNSYEYPSWVRYVIASFIMVILLSIFSRVFSRPALSWMVGRKKA